VSGLRHPASGTVTDTPNRVVIAGASAAGLSAAETLRRSGHCGTIMLIGSEPVACTTGRPCQRRSCLVPGRPTGSHCAQADVDALDLDARYGVAAIGLELATRTVALSDGTEVAFDGLIVATGVRPRKLPGAPAHVLRSLDDALALKGSLGPGSRLVVVGAGFLGCEVAAVAVGLGTEVIVVEPAAVPLAHAVGEDVGSMLAQAHRDHGVDLRTGTGVAEVVPAGVRLQDGSVIEADAVLVAIGSLPTPSGWSAAA
jgi:NADPH-dependent 2,4-dienoyl-CoA reductase/sulfur reductase-like enzyme